MVTGAALILSALLLLLYNQRQDSRAGEFADLALADMQSLIAEQIENRQDSSALDDYVDPYDEEAQQMTLAQIDGYDYIGCLSLPTLGLELPVMADWDYDRLRLAPCRQFGSTKSDDLVIAGHNYRRHFGKLKELRTGDLVAFTDLEGEIITYEVGGVDILPAAAVEDVKDSGWDLVLYTCTYGGQTRLTVFCDRVETQ